jgi:tetratricopeptide (TPR) repeat protein
MNTRRTLLLAGLLLVTCFTLAVHLDPWATSRADARGGSLFQILLGDGRRLFANHFFVKADAYFHRGVYPSIFDAPLQEVHMVSSGSEKIAATNLWNAPTNQSPAAAQVAEDPHHDDAHDHDHDHDPDSEAASATGSLDWIAWLNRRIHPEDHLHLESSGDAREMLPWLRLSAELDPQRIQTYTVAAYWLRSQLGKVDEAEQFLREGLRANPHSPELLFELGQIYNLNRQDPIRARNLYELALAQAKTGQNATNDDLVILREQLLMRLAKLEEARGNRAQAIARLEELKPLSPASNQIQAQIDELRRPESGNGN